MSAGMDRISTDPKLLAALERAKDHVMTPAEQHAQRRSFVRGQIGMAHPEMPAEELEALLDRAVGPMPPEAP